MSEENKATIPVAYAAGFALLSLILVNVVADELGLAEQERWVRLTAKAVLAAVLAVVFVLILGRLKRT